LWDRAQIDEGLRALAAAVRFRRPGQYQLQAAITALHIQAADPDATDWARIADLYAALGRLSPSPVVQVNHAAAAGFAHGSEVGLDLLRPLLADPALRQYQPLHATHAELLSRSGDKPAAAQAYQQAITLTENAVARSELRRRLDTLTSG
jgi:RNA polymerase sigma-70 factor (ECF subfamily)